MKKIQDYALTINEVIDCIHCQFWASDLLIIPLYDFCITRYLAGLIFKNTLLGFCEALRNLETR